MVLLRLSLISLAFGLLACEGPTANPSIKIGDPLIVRYLEEKIGLEGDKSYDVLVINNLNCNACSKASLDELQSLNDTAQIESQMILILAQKDSSFKARHLKHLNINKVHYNESNLAKYGMSKFYPIILKVREGELVSTKRFTGRENVILSE